MTDITDIADKYVQSVCGITFTELSDEIRSPDKSHRLLFYSSVDKCVSLLISALRNEKKINRNLFYLLSTYVRGDYISYFGWAHVEWHCIMDMSPFLLDKRILSINSGNAYIERLIMDFIPCTIICTDIESNVSSSFMSVEQVNAVDALQRYDDSDVLLSVWPPYIAETNYINYATECIHCNNGIYKEVVSQKKEAYKKYLNQRYRKLRTKAGICGKQIDIEIGRLLTKFSPKINLSNHDKCVFCEEPFSEEDCAYNALSVFRGNIFIHIGECSGGCTGSKKLFTLLNKEWKLIKRIDHPNWDGIHSDIQIYTRK
jgi:hypothetical protein